MTNIYEESQTGDELLDQYETGVIVSTLLTMRSALYDEIHKDLPGSGLPLNKRIDEMNSFQLGIFASAGLVTGMLEHLGEKTDKDSEYYIDDLKKEN